MIQKKIDKIVKKYKLSKGCESEIKRLTLECLIEAKKLSHKQQLLQNATNFEARENI